mmetsp:Transcript_35055/g.73008  ORF Transcript_35055/g.73008 Transcript_35055/m.73008 type:complete len:235 (-) Transcript_35055:459-1163(-)
MMMHRHNPYCSYVYRFCRDRKPPNFPSCHHRRMNRVILRSRHRVLPSMHSPLLVARHSKSRHLRPIDFQFHFDADKGNHQYKFARRVRKCPTEPPADQTVSTWTVTVTPLPCPVPNPNILPTTARALAIVVPVNQPIVPVIDRDCPCIVRVHPSPWCSRQNLANQILPPTTPPRIPPHINHPNVPRTNSHRVLVTVAPGTILVARPCRHCLPRHPPTDDLPKIPNCVGPLAIGE